MIARPEPPIVRYNMDDECWEVVSQDTALPPHAIVNCMRYTFNALRGRPHVRREEIAARLEEARAKHAKAIEDRVEAEHRVAVEVAETGSAARAINRLRHGGK